MARRLALLTVLLAAALASPRGAGAQAVAIADTTRGGVGVKLAFPDGIAGLRLPGAAVMPPRGPLGADAVVQRFRDGLVQQLALAALRRNRERLLARLYAGDSLALALRLDPAGGPRQGRDFLGLASSAVDLNLEGELELEISSDRFQNLRCTAYELQDPLSGCQPKFTAPRIDNRLKLEVSGIIGRRLHLDVDLDTQLDYTNANTIRAYYQGL